MKKMERKKERRRERERERELHATFRMLEPAHKIEKRREKRPT